jgi:RsiW-degrading membrane proteinase PrsW (M82 family)
MIILIVVTALLPVFILGWWIYRKDSLRPEPLRMLYKAFLFGVGSTFVSLLISGFLAVMGILSVNIETFEGALSTALFAAAVPEEVAKFLMLWLFMRSNKFYDEYLDGIVYAACIGLGFAGTENILYLLQSEDWVITGIVRGLTAVPGHFAMGCAMGYFFSKRHFGDKSTLTAICILAVPILIHWTWDALAFSEGIFPAVSVLISCMLVALIIYLYKSTKRRIAILHDQDLARMTPPPFPGATPTGTPLPPPIPGAPLPPPIPGSEIDNNPHNENTPLA